MRDDLNGQRGAEGDRGEQRGKRVGAKGERGESRRKTEKDQGRTDMVVNLRTRTREFYMNPQTQENRNGLFFSNLRKTYQVW